MCDFKFGRTDFIDMVKYILIYENIRNTEFIPNNSQNYPQLGGDTDIREEVNTKYRVYVTPPNYPL